MDLTDLMCSQMASTLLPKNETLPLVDRTQKSLCSDRNAKSQEPKMFGAMDSMAEIGMLALRNTWEAHAEKSVYFIRANNKPPFHT